MATPTLATLVPQAARPVLFGQPLTAQPQFSAYSARTLRGAALPLFWGQATPDYSVAGARGALLLSREGLRQVRGASLTAVGGNAAELGESDLRVNLPGSAAE